MEWSVNDAMIDRCRRKENDLRCHLVALALLIAGTATSADAQNVLTPASRFASEADAVKESVTRRPRPEYQPLGILMGDLIGGAWYTTRPSGLRELPTPASPNRVSLRPLDSAEQETAFVQGGSVRSNGTASSVLSSFILRPRLIVDGVYDDNIFRSDANKQSDLITVIQPRLRLESDWVNHGLTLEASGAFGRYADFGTEDYEDYAFRVAPKVDITEDNVVNLNFRLSRNHEDRAGVESQLQGVVPSENKFWDGQASWTYMGAFASSILRYDFRRQDAEDAGTVSRQIFDKDIHTAQWRLGWQFSPGRTVWIQPEYQYVEHRIFDSANNFDRDNSGWQALAGLTFDLSAVSYLEFGVGYLTRTFEEPTKDDFSGFAYRLRGVWNVTPLISLDVSAGRTVRPEDGLAATASIADEVSLTAAWDPFEQLILSIKLNYTDTDYEDLPGFAREDNQRGATLSGRYLLNENVFLEVSYEYVDFDSTFANDDYENNQFRLRAGVEL